MQMLTALHLPRLGDSSRPLLARGACPHPRRLTHDLGAFCAQGAEEDRRRFVAACVAAMSEHSTSGDGRSIVFLHYSLLTLLTTCTTYYQLLTTSS